jgi:hypothetical protein
MSFGIPVRNGLGVGLLASTTLSTRNRAPFSPASLFATGEQGAWYDPSDLTTLFQDSAGTTPVTAAGQPVGLMLDKSQGLVLGPEIVANGDFSSGTTGWTAINSTLAVVGGACEITAVGGAQARCSQSIATVVGRWYEVTARIWQGTGTVAVDVLITGITSSASVTTTTPTNVVVRFLAVATTTTIRVGSAGSAVAGTTFFADNISVKLLPGNHAFQSNSAQRPTLGRNPFTGTRNLLTFTEQFDNAAWTKNADTVTANATVAPDGTSTADKLIPNTSITQHFVTSADLTPGTCARSIYMKAGEYTFGGITAYYSTPAAYAGAVFNLANGTVTATSIGDTATITSVGDGWYRCTLVTSKVGATSFGGFQARAYASDPGTSFSVSFAGNGTSGIFIWGAQLEAGSTATAYQRVVSSFDVTEAGVPDVWYLSFDGTDDGMLTGTITPGTDKAQIFSGVRKLSDASATMMAELSVNNNTNAGTFTFISGTPTVGGPNYSSSSRGTAAADISQAAISAGSFAAPITNVVTATHDISGDLSAIRVNGAASGSNGVGDKGAGNFLAYPLYLGRRGGTSLPYNGRIYSFILRFGANLSASTILQTETWVGGKTGVTI